jgi:hypothetical protein
MKILGISYATFYRYIAQCIVCGEYLGKCSCMVAKTRLNAVNISPAGGKQNWRVSSDELNRLIESMERNVRR